MDLSRCASLRDLNLKLYTVIQTHALLCKMRFDLHGPLKPSKIAAAGQPPLMSIWMQGGSAATASVLLPQRLTAFTVLIKSASSDDIPQAPLPNLANLSSLRRLDLRFENNFSGPISVSAALPELPLGVTHLTIGARRERWSSSGWVPHLTGQARMDANRV